MQKAGYPEAKIKQKLEQAEKDLDEEFQRKLKMKKAEEKREQERKAAEKMSKTSPSNSKTILTVNQANQPMNNEIKVQMNEDQDQVVAE